MEKSGDEFIPEPVQIEPRRDGGLEGVHGGRGHPCVAA